MTSKPKSLVSNQFKMYCLIDVTNFFMIYYIKTVFILYLTMTDKNCPKIPKISKILHIFSCFICDYNTCNKKDYNKHLLTLKHNTLTKTDTFIDPHTDINYPKIPNYSCNCVNIKYFLDILKMSKNVYTKIVYAKLFSRILETPFVSIMVTNPK